MRRDKTRLQPKPSTRDRVLDAAERLLVQGSAGFSMRELANEAEVSFATPFNQFGNKGAIMLALSARRITLMHERLRQTALPTTAIPRVLAAVDIASAVMLEASAVNRAVMGVISAPTEVTGKVLSLSSALWAEALGSGDGLAAATRSLAVAILPDLLAVAFRGALSFWTAGEVADQALSQHARTAASVILLGFVEREDRAILLSTLKNSDRRARASG
jgi:AcrR family transcriptional regulator